MCGIAGLFNYRSMAAPEPGLLARMTRVVEHRGPDDEGIEIVGPCGLGNRRLSIIDIAGGHMPMSTPDGRFWITYNGELYNFRELRKDLEARGHRFRTRGDTEVLLHHFVEHGTDGPAQWNGMFGVAIFDRLERRLFLARDHFGIKPLYYFDDGRTLYFGSELKSILADPRVPRELDRDALSLLLTLRYLPSPRTLLEGIRKLPPGHFLICDESGIRVQRYFTETPTIDERITEREILAEHRRLLGQAVDRQMVADVPVGLLLSGGVDSAALAHYMAVAAPGKVHTFSVGFRGVSDSNELDDARKTAAWVGTEHHELMIEQDDFMDFFPKSFEHLEEPISEPTISPYFYVCRFARQSLKVVMMGQGADEPLAGYNRYLGERYHGPAGKLLRNTPLLRLIELLPRLDKMKMSARSLAEADDLERILKICTVFQPDWQQKLWRNGDAARRDGRAEARAILGEVRSRVTHLPSFAQFLYMDARTLLSDDFLLFGDKIAMANSLEVRVPYLDLDLVRFIESVPPRYKIRRGQRKYFHKKALRAVLPAEIMRRKKRGFTAPVDEWFRREVAGQVRAVLLHADAAVAEVFDQSTIGRIIDLHVQGREDFRKQIFLLLSYEFWAQRFLHGRSVGFADYEASKVTGG